MRKHIGHTIHSFDQLESTNNYAMDKMRHNGMTHGEVVWAKHQTAGKGQRGNVWVSEPDKNLLFSIVLRPDLKVEDQYKINMFVSVAIHKFLSSLGLENIQIKYPNDILVNEAKIAGILTQTSVMSKKNEYAIVGVGLNVNQDEFFDLKRKITSLRILVNKKFSLQSLLVSVLKYLDDQYDKLFFNFHETELYYKKYLI